MCTRAVKELSRYALKKTDILKRNVFDLFLMHSVTILKKQHFAFLVSGSVLWESYLRGFSKFGVWEVLSGARQWSALNVNMVYKRLKKKTSNFQLEAFIYCIFADLNYMLFYIYNLVANCL